MKTSVKLWVAVTPTLVIRRSYLALFSGTTPREALKRVRGGPGGAWHDGVRFSIR